MVRPGCGKLCILQVIVRVDLDPAIFILFIMVGVVLIHLVSKLCDKSVPSAPAHLFLNRALLAEVMQLLLLLGLVIFLVTVGLNDGYLLTMKIF